MQIGGKIKKKEGETGVEKKNNKKNYFNKNWKIQIGGKIKKREGEAVVYKKLIKKTKKITYFYPLKYLNNQYLKFYF